MYHMSLFLGECCIVLLWCTYYLFGDVYVSIALMFDVLYCNMSIHKCISNFYINDTIAKLH